MGVLDIFHVMRGELHLGTRCSTHGLTTDSRGGKVPCDDGESVCASLECSGTDAGATALEDSEGEAESAVTVASQPAQHATPTNMD